MKHIIIADDDPGIQEMVKILLKQYGYETEIHPDGQRLLNNDFEEPLLFIIDRQLQDMDGLDICRFLKARKNIHTPVIIFSATANLDTQVEKAGADAFLEKPFSVKRIIQMIEDFTTPSRVGEHAFPI